jgi:ribosome-associated toxin RatA of RatAB toxin-antitoxin module
MKKNNLILVLFYSFLGISLTMGYVYLDSSFGNVSVDILPKQTSHLHQEKIVDVELFVIYDLMTDIEKFPIILPKNIISVTIIEKIGNKIIGEIEVMEAGIKTKVKFEQITFPPEKQILEVTSGYAKGTKFTQTFSEYNSQTKIVTNVKLDFKGLLTPFSYLPKSNLNHAMNTIIMSFVDFSNREYTDSENIVDDLYRKILLRPVDLYGLQYYSNLLDNNKMTKNELETILLNSEERKSSFFERGVKSLEEINPQTKNKINKLYNEFLNRDADTQGMIYYGTMLELEKMTEEEMKNELFYSSEGMSIRYQKVGVSTVDLLFVEILDRHATQDELDKFVSLIISNMLSEEELRLKLYDLEKIP